MTATILTTLNEIFPLLMIAIYGLLAALLISDLVDDWQKNSKKSDAEKKEDEKE